MKGTRRGRVKFCTAAESFSLDGKVLLLIERSQQVAYKNPGGRKK